MNSSLIQKLDIAFVFFICVFGFHNAQAMELSLDTQIDFDTVTSVPFELRQIIITALHTGEITLPSAESFTVTAVRTFVDDDWSQVFLVPTSIINSAWEVDFSANDYIEILIHHPLNETAEVAIVDDSNSIGLIRQLPSSFLDIQDLSITSSSSDVLTAVDYLFPWTREQYWFRVGVAGGWHEGNALDFQPVLRTSPETNYAVLAAASGRLSEICNDGYQSQLRIEHSEGTTIYLHLNVNSIRRDLLGQNIQRGQYIGQLYTGTQGGSGDYQFSTRCGRGTALHLHIIFPSRDITIDGYNVNQVASSAFATRYRSTNTRIDNSSGSNGDSQNCGSNEGAILYEHPNYTGRCSRFTEDDGNISDNTIGNDAASSIRIIGNYEATVYADGNYGGTSSRFTGDDPDFGNDSINHDRVSSIRVRRRDASGGSNCDGAPGVYLYEHGSFQGKCSKFTGDSPDAGGWYVGNDSASSIRINGNFEATLYEQGNYNGASSTFSGEDSDLGNDTVGNDRVSSIRVRQSDASSSGSSNCSSGDGVFLYEHSNYQGRCSKFTSDSPNPGSWYVGNDSATSIKVVGNYEATLFENDNYQGSQSTFQGDDTDIGNDSIGNDRASSIRVHTRTASVVTCNTGQFLAEYFNNRTLSGSPVLRRCESRINNDWALGGPDSGVANDNFSVRWRGEIWFDSDAIYRFTARSDDGFRVWVDGFSLINQWRDMAATTFTQDRNLAAGVHTVQMEYYEAGGHAVAQLSWQRQQTTPAQDTDGGEIGYGGNSDGTIDPANDKDEFFFNGTVGQAITIRMDKRDSNLDSYLELYNPDGSLLAQNDDSDGRNARIAISLRQNGRHKIITRDYGTSTGGYRVSLSQESTADPDDERWITFGGTLQGTISSNNDRDIYYVAGVTGRVLSLRMNKADSGLDPWLEVYSPAGVKVAENDDGGGDRNSWVIYTLPADGTYRIQARSYNLASSGRYNLVLGTVTRSNMAQGKSAWATSTEFSGVEAAKAFDGNTSTRWSSSFADPQLIYVDLGSTKTFNQVVLRWEAAYARRYGIYYWNGSQWINLFWTDSGDGGNDTITFNPVRAQHVAMYGVQRGTSYGYSLWEFEVYDNSSLPLPIVSPDPEDKPAEGNVDSVTPLPPTGDGKDVLLIGDGDAGQENTPLAGASFEPLEAIPQSGVPVAHLFYPTATTVITDTSQLILFQGEAADNDENGDAIVKYRWISNLDGQIGASDIFTLTTDSLSAGEHTITFQAQDNEGVWSEPVTTILQINVEGSERRVYLPLVAR